MGVKRIAGEWFQCTAREVRAAVRALRERRETELFRTETFGMRPEQRAAVEKTSAYFRTRRAEEPDKTFHFLWNCKMRFGKTFAAYQLAKAMGWKRLLVLTFKPAVQSAWETDLRTHVDFEGWQFISHDGVLTYDTADRSRPIVCFGSFQDYLGRTKAGGIKARNEWVHAINWDCVILDEYHFGAWRENAKELFENEDRREQAFAEGGGLDYFDEELMPITTGAYLYLSGTPFRILNRGEFIEEQIYAWTYSDEQRAKAAWNDADGTNPYTALPRMVMMTYQLPDALQAVAKQGEYNEFDLNVFFAAEGQGEAARFRYEDEVQKWLDLIRGAYSENIVSDLKLRSERPPMPFSHAPLLASLTHTFWFLPTVAACHAMRNLLAQRQNRFYHDYNVIVAAGAQAGIGIEALKRVEQAMGNPLETKTITLSCGKLTTGVSVKPWSGIFMLRNSSSPETYFQAAFRVQTPWTVSNPDGLSPDKTEILKQECYVFDFAPNRALRQLSEYCCLLNDGAQSSEKKVAEFIHFLPVLAYDGSSMKQIDAAGILDIATSGTTATLLAKRWHDAALVNVDTNTLRRLMNNAEAMAALMNIEGFRTLNSDIATIINKSEAVKKAKRDTPDEAWTKERKRELTDEEKEYKSIRKKIQEKLIKFATRIPIFMYLTDYREQCLRDVITKLEPALFRKVTGLSIRDFELLVSLGLFNSALMNDAVGKFKRYEDASLEYIGINRHASETRIGLNDTVITKDEYRQVFVNRP
ncbi:restriction endonuclease [uncultured Bacteroides sp.]|uniref:restriction endonuclease n=1 Tax=uncultured Bacteroides sp. TaxID=162156 RepID=UPI002634448E|nr:restriction endonuclease [uncultured Bacteroides sp.]